MQRGLAAILLFAAALLLAIASGGWWLQRVAFNPEVSASSMPTVFENEELRQAVATLVAEATADHIPPTDEQLVVQIEAQFPAMINDHGASGVLSELVRQVHGQLIGTRDAPAQLTGHQMIEIVRYQLVYDVDPVAFPVGEIGWLSAIRSALSWLVPITAIAGLATVVLGLVAKPSRDDVVFGVGVLCVVGACLAFVFGYLVPGYAITFLADEEWASLIPAVADDYLPVVSGTAVGLAALGCVMVFGSSALRRRRTKSWSAPVRPRRDHSEQRQWSR